MTAVGVASTFPFKTLLCIFGFLIAVIWTITSFQIWRVITSLHELYHENFADDEINNRVFQSIQWKTTFGRTVFGPTELISLWLPNLILLAWISIGFMLGTLCFPANAPTPNTTAQ